MTDIILTMKGEKYVAEHEREPRVILTMPTRTEPLYFGLTGAQVRAAIENEIDRLLDLLDAFDGDDELEPDEDFEPSLGGYSQLAVNSAGEIVFEADLEQDNCDDEDGDQDEGVEDYSHDVSNCHYQGGFGTLITEGGGSCDGGWGDQQ